MRYELSPIYVPLSPLSLKVGVMPPSSYGSAAHASMEFPWKNNIVYTEFHGIPWKYHRIMVLHGNFSGFPHEFSMVCCADLGTLLDFNGNSAVTMVFRGISPGSWSFIAYVFMAP